MIEQKGLSAIAIRHGSAKEEGLRQQKSINDESFFENTRRDVLSSERKYLRPLALKCGDRLKLGQLNGRLVVQRHVRPEEVIMSHEERGQDHRAVVAVKTGSGPHVILVGPV